MNRPTLSINNITITPNMLIVEKGFAKIIMRKMFMIIDFQYSPLEVLKDNLLQLFEISQEFFTALYQYSNITIEKRECSTMLKTLGGWKRYWLQQSIDRENLIRLYWAFIMHCEELPNLSGFEISHSHGSNAERRTLRSIIKT